MPFPAAVVRVLVLAADRSPLRDGSEELAGVEGALRRWNARHAPGRGVVLSLVTGGEDEADADVVVPLVPGSEPGPAVVAAVEGALAGMRIPAVVEEVREARLNVVHTGAMVIESVDYTELPVDSLERDLVVTNDGTATAEGLRVRIVHPEGVPIHVAGERPDGWTTPLDLPARRSFRIPCHSLLERTHVTVELRWHEGGSARSVTYVRTMN